MRNDGTWNISGAHKAALELIEDLKAAEADSEKRAIARAETAQLHQKIREAARKKYPDKEVTLNSNGLVRSGGHAGWWVQAEVFVYKEEIKEDS
jgi:hypothetical protein